MAGLSNILKRDPAILARSIRDDAVKSLATMQTRRAKAEADVAAAEAAQAQAAADSEASPETLEASTRKLRDVRDLLTAFDERILPAAKQNIAAAERVIVEREKQGVYEAAKTQGKAAATRVEKEYPDLATRYGQLLLTVQEADAAIEAANANLPEGREPLLTVEALTRDHQSAPREEQSSKVKDLWFYETGEMVVRQELVRPSAEDPNKGVYIHPKNGMVHHLGPDRCVKRTRRVVVTIPPIIGAAGPRLADTPLPPLRYPAAARPEPETQYLAIEASDEAA